MAEQILHPPALLQEKLLAASRLNDDCSYDEADALVLEIIEQCPDLPGPFAHYVGLAWQREDLLGTVARANEMRVRFPQQPAGYFRAVAALRLLRDLEQSEAALADGLKRFSTNLILLSEAALLAEASGDWKRAEAWMTELRRLAPNQVMSWVQGARSFLRGKRIVAAEALLTEAMARFPNEPQLYALFAFAAEERREWEEAALRWQSACDKFPDRPDIVLGHALVLGKQPKSADGERRLSEMFAHLERLHAIFPDFAEGYRAHIMQLREGGRLDEAEALAHEARTKFPDNASIAIECTRVIRELKEIQDVVDYLDEAVTAMPNNPLIAAELTSALAEAAHLDEAEAIGAAACARFRYHPRTFMQHAETAMRRNDLNVALTRWIDGSKRFPQADNFLRGIVKARLAMIDRGGNILPADDVETPLPDNGISIRKILMEFESLGGPGMGCEFALVQRFAGAEPLGLLRWTGITIDMLIDALKTRFEGVGTPEQTDLITVNSDYMILDHRFAMKTHTFIAEGGMPRDRLFEESCRRLIYLKSKLLRDLSAARKIFVYRLGSKTTTRAEIEALYEELQAFGQITLFCVTVCDDNHALGSVERLKPRLLMGYVNELKVWGASEVATWHELCRRAYRLARPELAWPELVSPGEAVE